MHWCYWCQQTLGLGWPRPCTGSNCWKFVGCLAWNLVLPGCFCARWEIFVLGSRKIWSWGFHNCWVPANGPPLRQMRSILVLCFQCQTLNCCFHICNGLESRCIVGTYHSCMVLLWALVPAPLLRWGYQLLELESIIIFQNKGHWDCTSGYSIREISFGNLI